ncbi:hypothetical protein RB595_000593 [Gaeumannomyces hyphopodioides]
MADGGNPASTPTNSTGSSGRDVPLLHDRAANGWRRPAHHHPPSTTPASAAPPQPQPYALAPGHGLRRAATIAEPSLRRRAVISPLEQQGFADPGSGARRRDSVISSDCSLDALNSPGRRPAIGKPDWPAVPDLQALPLLFALLPALGGLIFKDGSAFITDFLLLGLAAVFLHTTVTHPWSWYHSAQQIRIAEEIVAEEVVDEHDYDNPGDEDSSGGDEDASSMDGDEKPPNKRASQSATKPQGVRHAALRELYFHEIAALLLCFLSPAAGASILHGIRTQLSRPSEGLVSNYNLTVFLLAAEIQPVRHLMRLVEARTIHLQRIVLANPYASNSPRGASTADGGVRGGGEPAVTATQLAVLAARVEELESRTVTEAQAQAAHSGPAGLEARSPQRDAILREARSQMQPEVDALNRAVRRYEKKQTILAVQLDGRLQMLDGRLDDALALAAHAAKNSRPRPSFLASATDQVLVALMLPFRGIWLVACLPVRLLATALGRDQRQTENMSKGYRSGRSSRSSSTGGDRFPARLSRR